MILMMMIMIMLIKQVKRVYFIYNLTYPFKIENFADFLQKLSVYEFSLVFYKKKTTNKLVFD